MAGEQYEIYESGTAAALAEWQLAALAEKPDGTAYAPDLTAGAALGITGEATDSAAWLQRVSTSDGPTTAKSIHGRTLRWNQLVSDSDTSVTVPSGHKYVARIDGTTTLATSDGTAITVTGGTDSVFDLTAMFGAGSEPSTVAEFEALYPADYYPYDAGSLLSVNIEGVESTGKNLLPNAVASGAYGGITVTANHDGSFTCNGSVPSGGSSTWIPISQGFEVDSPSVLSGCPAGGSADMYFIQAAKVGASTKYDTGNGVQLDAGTYTIHACIVRGATVSNKTFCPQLERGASKTSYEPYAVSEHTIPVADYFPNGMRSAGTVRDELTSTEAITRVGVVDLGTLDWTLYNGVFFAQISTMNINGNQPVQCAAYTVDDSVHSYAGAQNMADKSIAGGNGSGGGYVYVKDSAYTDAATFKTAMSGVMLHYALATPTTTPIDPPLNLTYKVEQGGTERIMVPTGENSAPPTLVTAQGYTAESLRDAALSAIAPVENGKASTNYGIGSYLVHGGQLCRVTTAIATGEAITIGTNVTATTVMAEVIALIAQ